MSQKAELSNHPLPEALTGRVISYLNVFRMVLSIGLLAALFAGFVTAPQLEEKIAVAGAVLISYSFMAIYLTIQARRRTAQPFFLAKISLFTDVFFLSILLSMFGGLESGIAVLLIFTSASAAILLPLRLALLFASLVVLVFIGESSAGMFFQGETPVELVQAGLYGATTFTITIVVNVYSYVLRIYTHLCSKIICITGYQCDSVRCKIRIIGVGNRAACTNFRKNIGCSQINCEIIDNIVM